MNRSTSSIASKNEALWLLNHTNVDRDVLASSVAEMPDTLYHATSLENYRKIKSDGEIRVNQTKNWQASRSGSIYLSDDKDTAIEYCNRLDMESVVCLEIDVNMLDLNRLFIDANEEVLEDDDYGFDVFSFEYRGNIPFSAIVSVEDEYGNDIKGMMLDESLKKLQPEMFVTGSELDLLALFENRPKVYRILYDDNIKKYVVGNAGEYIHTDMFTELVTNGYYSNNKKVGEIMNAVSCCWNSDVRGLLLGSDNYLDTGRDGAYDDELSIDPYLVYMVFSPSDEFWALGDDGYDKAYTNSSGTIYTRDTDFKDCGLYEYWMNYDN